MERESLELKKKNVLHWDIGLRLSVQLYFLLNRSKLQYPYFEIIPFYDNVKFGIRNENENENKNDKKNENENENEKIILNRISHSYFPFISLRGHSWRRVIIALQHLKTPKHEIQNMVSYVKITEN